MLWRRRPNVRKATRRGDAKRLVRALVYYDRLSDSQGRLYDLGAGVRRDAALALASVADTGEVDIGAALIGALEIAPARCDERPPHRSARTGTAARPRRSPKAP